MRTETLGASCIANFRSRELLHRRWRGAEIARRDVAQYRAQVRRAFAPEHGLEPLLCHSPGLDARAHPRGPRRCQMHLLATTILLARPGDDQPLVLERLDAASQRRAIHN